MRFHCYEAETEFVFCVEGAKGEVYDALQTDPYWTEAGDHRFIKVYSTDTDFDDAWYLDPTYKEAIAQNFARLGESWIRGEFDWESVLLKLARMFLENEIRWYVTGSASEAVLGVNVRPNDLDIVVHTDDFFKVKDLTHEYVIEPLGDNKGNWIIRYFGKLCVDGASVDIAADEKMNPENDRTQYEKVLWNGYEVHITPLHERYAVEIQRGRKDRIKAIEEYMNRQAL